MEIIRGVQSMWEKWKSGAPEREINKEERQRYRGKIMDSAGFYRRLSDEDKEFVNNWAKKIIGFGGISVLVSSEKHDNDWKSFISDLEARTLKPSGIYLRSIQKSQKEFGSAFFERSVYKSHLANSIFYRVWLMEKRTEKGLPPPKD